LQLVQTEKKPSPIIGAKKNGGAKQISPVTTTILLPAYNEAEALPEVLSGLMAIINKSYEILIVDDGSTDGTPEIAEAAGCRVIRHTKNSGKGAAVRTGVDNARGRYIIIMDADDTYPVDAIPQMVKLLADHDFVRCTRSSGTEHIPLVNRIGNWVFDTILQGIYHLEGQDHLSGLYGVRTEVIRAIGIESNGFDIEVELGVKTRAYGLRAAMLPIGYRPRIGEKKLRPVQDGLKILMRTISMALLANPRLVFIYPGVIVWAISGGLLAILSQGPITTPFFGLHGTTFLMAALGLVVGFQMIVFGVAASLYAAELGMRSEPWLAVVTSARLRTWAGSLGALQAFCGFSWSATMAAGWWHGGAGPFRHSQEMLLSTVIMLIGFQLTMATLFISVLSNRKRERSDV
jgi:hypothetical protein